MSDPNELYITTELNDIKMTTFLIDCLPPEAKSENISHFGPNVRAESFAFSTFTVLEDDWLVTEIQRTLYSDFEPTLEIHFRGGQDDYVLAAIAELTQRTNWDLAYEYMDTLLLIRVSGALLLRADIKLRFKNIFEQKHISYTLRDFTKGL